MEENTLQKIEEEVKKEVKKVKEEVKKTVAPVEAPVEVIAKEAMVSFDAWFAARKKAIPVQHYKEIILADMKARGTEMMNTIANFDAALAKYGVKLK
jgi:hypothetical protein